MLSPWPGLQVPGAEMGQKHDGVDPILLSQNMGLTSSLPSAAFEYGRNPFLCGSERPLQSQQPMPVEAVLRCQETEILRSNNVYETLLSTHAGRPANNLMMQERSVSDGELVSFRANMKDPSLNPRPSYPLCRPDAAADILPSPNTAIPLVTNPSLPNTITTRLPSSYVNTIHLLPSVTSSSTTDRTHRLQETRSDEDESADGGNVRGTDSLYMMNCGANSHQCTTPQPLLHNHPKEFSSKHNLLCVGGGRVLGTEYGDLARLASHGCSKASTPWQAVSVNSSEYQPSALPFSSPTGPVNASSNDSPLEILRKIFDAKLVEIIILEINRFGRKINSEEISVGPKKKKIKTEGMIQTCKQSSCKKKAVEWLDVDVVEFWSLMAVLLYMSVVKIPTIKRYWNKELWGQPTVQSLMKRDRFCTLLRCLELADQQDVNSLDNANIERITSILAKMSSNFRREYKPACQLNLTETMIQSNGKNKYKSLNTELYQPLAIRSYILCEAKTGYVLDFFVHSGKSTPYHSDLGLKYDSNQTSELAACKLLDNFQGKGHVLFSDCYYSSPHLFAYFRSQAGIDCVGLTQPTVDGFPDGIKPTNTHVGKGEVVNMVTRINNATVLAQTWRLKEEGSPKFVSILSTKHSAATKVVAQKNKGYLHKPVSYLEFSEFSGGIDKVDQTVMPFPGEEGPSSKYPYKVFLRFVHLALHNAYVIWRSFEPKPILGYGTNFRLQLVKELKREADASMPRPSLWSLPSLEQEEISVSSQRRHDVAAAVGGHSLTRTALMASNLKRRSRRRCAHCWNDSFKRSQTTFECNLCNLGFCMPCFKEYHDKLKSPSSS